MPAMITNRTMKSLTPTRTRLTRSDSLMPMETRAVSARRGGGRAGRSATPAEARGHGEAQMSRSVAYGDQPWATTLGAEHQLQEQVPADDPRDQLAQRGVGERVGRPRPGTVEANSA